MGRPVASAEAQTSDEWKERESRTYIVTGIKITGNSLRSPKEENLSSPKGAQNRKLST